MRASVFLSMPITEAEWEDTGPVEKNAISQIRQVLTDTYPRACSFEEIMDEIGFNRSIQHDRT